MSKFQLKKDVNPKGVVHYRVPKLKDDDKPTSGIRRVVLSEATALQLAHLAKLKHPFIEEVKVEGPKK